MCALPALLAVAAVGCGRCGAARPAIAARYDGGVVTVEDLHREASRLPPILRARLETDAGRRDLLSAVVEKRLLAGEARRRGLDRAPEIRREVEELEERLAIQALLAAEEKAMGAPSDVELRAWFEAHQGELGERAPGRRPSFEEARGEIANRLEPARKRKAFDELLARLRKEADVRIEEAPR
jgi:peptidyl-prolyl cis-trans isomerase C